MPVKPIAVPAVALASEVANSVVVSTDLDNIIVLAVGQSRDGCTTVGNITNVPSQQTVAGLGDVVIASINV